MLSAMQWRNAALISMSLLSFAGNSLLCRLALSSGAIDPVGFTLVRLLSGAAVLFLLLFLNSSTRSRISFSKKHDWHGAVYLFIYALSFSLAYVSMDAASGALVLFSSVQFTILLFSFLKGERLNLLQSLGGLIAFTGFVYLILPAANTPSLAGILMMTLSGIAWGLYTLKGKNSSEPIVDSYLSFLKSIPFAVLAFALSPIATSISIEGLLYGIFSGGITSALGYALWYAVLPSLKGVESAILQLTVPIITALLAVLLLEEALQMNTIISGIAICLGIAMVIYRSSKPA